MEWQVNNEDELLIKINNDNDSKIFQDIKIDTNIFERTLI